MHGGEGDEAILDRDWLGFVKAEVMGLLRLGLLLGLLLYLWLVPTR